MYVGELFYLFIGHLSDLSVLQHYPHKIALYGRFVNLCSQGLSYLRNFFAYKLTHGDIIFIIIWNGAHYTFAAIRLLNINNIVCNPIIIILLTNFSFSLYVNSFGTSVAISCCIYYTINKTLQNTCVGLSVISNTQLNACTRY